MVIPRGGEVTRAIAIKKTAGVLVETGLGTIVSERIVDLLFLLACIGGVFIFKIDDIVGFFSERDDSGQESSHLLLYVLVATALVGFGSVFLFYFFQRRLFLKIYAKGKVFLFGLKGGLLSIFKLEQKGLFIFYSFLIWIFYFFMLYFVLLAFEDTAGISFGNALAVFVIGGIAMTLPVPGGAGSYHLLVSAALVYLCSISENNAIAFATIFHGLQTVFLIFLGGLSMFAIEKGVKKYKNAL